MIDSTRCYEFFKTLQIQIVQGLEAIDGGEQKFLHDSWQREQGGGGTSCVIEHGNIFARGGVNFSHVFGDQLPPSASASRPELAGRNFEAMGVSLVLHPENPYIPTVHMNVRHFIARKDGAAPVWWFGGGMDLTPYYGFEEDARHFHRVCRDSLTEFGDYYEEYKNWCDRYFYLKHRQEARGVGGIFFDDFNAHSSKIEGSDEEQFEHCFALTRSVGEHFLRAYSPIVEARKHMEFGERERAWQAFRRGRYVEFNLVHDRGTLFGLQSGGRTESILMSMPPVVHWKYAYTPDAGTPEARLLSDFLPPKDWLK